MDDTKTREPDDERAVLHTVALIEATELNRELATLAGALAVTVTMLSAYIVFKALTNKW